MAWFKVDDGFYGHPKVASASLGAIGLWALAGSWSTRYRTFGRIPKVIVTNLFDAETLAHELVSVGLWEECEDGWKFTHWRKWQDGDYRRNIPASVRRAVMTRDGFACVECGATDDLSLDHIIRYRDDGPDTADNLRVLCMPCNTRRG